MADEFSPSGGDLDLRTLELGDLDPHAVASLFKAYLRERKSIPLPHSIISTDTYALNSVPESLLTDALSPAFDATMLSHTGQKALGGLTGFAPVHNPTPHATKPPPPNHSLPQSAALIEDIATLVRRLPPYNFYLLKEISELLEMVSEASETTKMVSLMSPFGCDDQS